MTDSRAEEVLRRQARMEAERAPLDAVCQEVAEHVLTRHGDFTTRQTGEAAWRARKVFDSTAPLALDKFAAAIESMLTPRTSRWHELAMRDWRDVRDRPAALPEAVRAWLGQVNETLFSARYAAGANFAAQAHETYVGLGAFGNGALFVDEAEGGGLRYRSIPFAETWFAENFQGQVDTVHRKFELTARQWLQRFGEETPDSIRRAAEQEPHRRFELIHCVGPRQDADWSRRDWRGMAFASWYVSFEGRKLLKEQGYRTLRYAVARYVTAPREVYGRGPAMAALADIKTINAQQRTLLRTGQMIAEPPLLLSDEGGLSAFKLGPGTINRGALSHDGTELVRPLQVGANMPISLEMISHTRESINQAFLVTLFQILVETPQMTATEAMLRAQEKGALLAPVMGRLQSELLGPLVQAELDILAGAGALPDMPPELDALENVVADIDYTSPLARAQKSDEGLAILRLLEDAAAVGQFDPSAAKMIKGPETLRRLAEIRGAPAGLLRSPEDMEALAGQDAAMAQLQAMLGAAGQAAGAAKDAAAAGLLEGGQ
ncbi:MAG: phage head-tail adapter protein [Caulobacteraceae bacterium]|nr:MAG: phage head-tail adapter protein [Caulobacteraceae bacterium]